MQISGVIVPLLRPHPGHSHSHELTVPPGQVTLMVFWLHRCGSRRHFGAPSKTSAIIVLPPSSCTRLRSAAAASRGDAAPSTSSSSTAATATRILSAAGASIGHPRRCGAQLPELSSCCELPIGVNVKCRTDCHHFGYASTVETQASAITSEATRGEYSRVGVYVSNDGEKFLPLQIILQGPPVVTATLFAARHDEESIKKERMIKQPSKAVPARQNPRDGPT